ncbi:MAG: dockerin type I repeat-containing protein, partial [Clostridia bacterium]|nr:dockerin type I repeat-containing protein [Clostridia bacterium]
VFAIITLSKSGDPSGDGEINAVDAVLLAQVIAGWDVELDISAADCNGDGEVNAIDAVLLAQFIAGWDVVLG